MALTLSLKNSLIGVTAALTLAAGTFSLGSVFEASGELDVAKRSAASSETGQLLMASGAGWAEERGLTGITLAAASAASPSRIAEIGDRRESADAAFEEALVRLETEWDRPDGTRHLAEVRRRFDDLARLRAELDAQFALPAEARDARLLETAMPTITAMIVAAEDLRVLSRYRAESAVTRIEALQDLQHSLWVMLEYAGRERGTLGPVIASGRALASAELQALSELRGHIAEAWARVESLAQLDLASPSLQEQIVAVDAAYFGAFDVLRSSVYGAGVEGRSYPLDAASWFAEATSAMASIGKLRDAALAEALDLTREVAADERSQFLLNIGLSAFCLLLGAVGVWVSLFRVARPVQAMTETMRRLAGGEKAFCVNAVKFEISNELTCADQEFDEAVFKRVEIGSAPSATYDFTSGMFVAPPTQ